MSFGNRPGLVMFGCIALVVAAMFVVTNAITRSPVLSVIYDRRIDSPRDLNDLPI